jgi:hypothetical protein
VDLFKEWIFPPVKVEGTKSMLLVVLTSHPIQGHYNFQPLMVALKEGTQERKDKRPTHNSKKKLH